MNFITDIYNEKYSKSAKIHSKIKDKKLLFYSFKVNLFCNEVPQRRKGALRQ